MGKLTESMVLQRTRQTDLESVRELNCWFVNDFSNYKWPYYYA